MNKITSSKILFEIERDFIRKKIQLYVDIYLDAFN